MNYEWMGVYQLRQRMMSTDILRYCWLIWICLGQKTHTFTILSDISVKVLL